MRTNNNHQNRCSNNKSSTYPTSPVFISKANRKKNVFTSFLSESHSTCCRIAHGQRWGLAGFLSPRISLWHRLALGVGDLLLRLTYGAYSCARCKITDARASITHWITGSSFYVPLSLSHSLVEVRIRLTEMFVGEQLTEVHIATL